MNGKIIDCKGGVAKIQPWNGVHNPSVVFFAGVAGGLAEVLWVGASAAVFGVDASQVAREVAATVMPATIATTELGLAIHFVLSLGLATLFGLINERLSPRVGMGMRLAVAVALLTGVWAVNFLMLLPWLNPVFTGFLPLGVTLISKLLFALALWGTFAVMSRNPQARTRVSTARTMGAS